MSWRPEAGDARGQVRYIVSGDRGINVVGGIAPIGDHAVHEVPHRRTGRTHHHLCRLASATRAALDGYNEKRGVRDCACDASKQLRSAPSSI